MTHENTTYPLLVRIMQAEGDPVFAVSRHSRAQIVVDDNFMDIAPDRYGIAHLLLTAPAMYEMLKETLDWMDEQYPADKYPLDPDNHYRRNFHDLVIARRRENIRCVLMQAEGQREMITFTPQKRQEAL